MYVLAQFSERTSFDWLTRLRAQLGKDELKHADYLHAGLLYATETDLWKVVDAGVQQASIFIVDPHTYVMQLIPEFLNSGAEYRVDFTWTDILHLAAEKMIAETPAYELTNSSVSMELVRLTCARNPLCGLLTPNCLPLPSDVLKRIGGRIRGALRFAARVLDIKIQAASVNTGSEMKDDKLRNKDFFNAKDDPYITFHSDKVVETGPTTFELPGTFTIRGVSKPETLTFTTSDKGKGVGSVKGTMAFDRKEFGMNSGIPFIKIADRVEVSVDLKGKRVSGPPLVFKQ